MVLALHSSMVRSLADPGPDLDAVGGKAESLSRLARAGFPVPPGFVLTTEAYRSFVDAHGLAPVISAALAGLPRDDHRALEQTSAGIRGRFTTGTVPSTVVNELRRAYAGLGHGRVAVRSSATAEDLPGMSFAGQQDTILDVGDPDALLHAVRACWASLWTARAIAYRARFGVGPDDIALAVVVQRMINAEASGVMFTADPVTGLDSAITINSTWGLGEALVGGEVTPDSFEVDRRTGKIVHRHIARKNVMTVRSAEGTGSAPVPDDLRFRASLTDEQVVALARAGRRITNLYQTAMDIEWCRVGSDFWILQARPITTGHRDDPWNDSYRGDFLWTNTNVGEAIPDVMTPATWSMVQVFLSDAMATASIPPYVGYGRIGGRIYLNVSVMKTLSGVVGISERNFRSLTEEVFGRLPDGVVIPSVPVSRAKVLRAVLPVALHVLSEARIDVLRLHSYLAAHPELCLRRRRSIESVRSARALATMWRKTLLPEFEQVSKMLSAATRSSGASFVTTRKRLLQMVGPAGANAVTAGVGEGTDSLASMGLLEGLDRLAAGRITAEQFNDRYGHRGPHEFEISTPRPGEDPGWVAEQLAQRTDNVARFTDLMHRQEQVRELAWRRLNHRYPLQAVLLRRQVAHWGKIARNRERARSEVIRYLWVLRAYALRAGELTGLGQDIFFLDADEIVEVLEGGPVDRSAVADRRRIYESYRALPPYPGLIRGPFDPFSWAADPARRTDLHMPDARASGSGSSGRAVRGFPGSAGVVEGTARVITSVAEGDRLGAGEVLVTAVTNVGWTPLFPRAGAIVTDVGAPLSHAAIVARELGIPAVVGCGDATMRIRSGDRVRVDGSGGVVEVLRPD